MYALTKFQTHIWNGIDGSEWPGPAIETYVPPINESVEKWCVWISLATVAVSDEVIFTLYRIERFQLRERFNLGERGSLKIAEKVTGKIRKMPGSRSPLSIALSFLFTFFSISNALYGPSSPVLQLTSSNFKSKVNPLSFAIHLS